jgi:hypothetical protein
MIWYVEEEQRQGQHDSASVPEYFSNCVKVPRKISEIIKLAEIKTIHAIFLAELGGIGFGTLS